MRKSIILLLLFHPIVNFSQTKTDSTAVSGIVDYLDFQQGLMNFNPIFLINKTNDTVFEYVAIIKSHSPKCVDYFLKENKLWVKRDSISQEVIEQGKFQFVNSRFKPAKTNDGQRQVVRISPWEYCADYPTRRRKEKVKKTIFLYKIP